ncbi:hypothetical protein GCM10009039_30680 [Halocalculus aciditolerans]|uniref:Uncharacterized protein n=1 Tax=Halocalculus aciditolerans TaxID=1383812 RepID=A0A830F7C7_9EURY|nr:hypothetical protein GCM10009039_30680 [Halocalculus aciditolerans]
MSPNAHSPLYGRPASRPYGKRDAERPVLLAPARRHIARSAHDSLRSSFARVARDRGRRVERDRSSPFESPPAWLVEKADSRAGRLVSVVESVFEVGEDVHRL